MLSTRLTELADYEALVARSGGHPVARWHEFARPMRRAWALGDAVGFTSVGRFGHAFVVVGADADAGALATAVLNGGPDPALEPVDSLTLPAKSLSAVDHPLGSGNDWDWFWTTESPPWRPGEAAVQRLDAGDSDVAAEVTELLMTASPRTSALPDGDPATHWYGIRDAQGSMVACAASVVADGIPNLRAIAVHPGNRDAGVGSDVTAAITRRAFDAGSPVVTLGMYADNDPARRMYERLGFRVGGAFSSRAVERLQSSSSRRRSIGAASPDRSRINRLT